uniref:Uncharacterized protein n=1 Tax=Vespula pensylvanica TaxID=30213 RepID=A0A834P3V2_VESPE|nr:hypothetical protein H0235_007012 [Vespula pensylvanica]
MPQAYLYISAWRKRLPLKENQRDHINLSGIGFIRFLRDSTGVRISQLVDFYLLWERYRGCYLRDEEEHREATESNLLEAKGGIVLARKQHSSYRDLVSRPSKLPHCYTRLICHVEYVDYTRPFSTSSWPLIDGIAVSTFAGHKPFLYLRLYLIKVPKDDASR